MKKFLIGLIFAIALVLSVSDLAEARVSRVKGYIRSNGTYVQPYYKTSPNKSKIDNWSTRGNYNPYTGKKGYVNPYKW